MEEIIRKISARLSLGLSDYDISSLETQCDGNLRKMTDKLYFLFIKKSNAQNYHQHNILSNLSTSQAFSHNSIHSISDPSQNKENKNIDLKSATQSDLVQQKNFWRL